MRVLRGREREGVLRAAKVSCLYQRGQDALSNMGGRRWRTQLSVSDHRLSQTSNIKKYKKYAEKKNIYIRSKDYFITGRANVICAVGLR